MDNQQDTQANDTNASDHAKKLVSEFAPDSVKKPVADLSNKLNQAADGADDVAKNLEKAMDDGIKQVEHKLDNFLGDLERFLGKF